MKRQQRYPWEPLWMIAEGRGLSMSSLAELSGVDRRDLHRHRAAGSISENHADHLAVGLGLVPVLIWPEWISDDERECAADWCDELFVPYRPQNIYCSRKCRRRAERRRAPKNPQSRSEANRRYYTACRSYVRAQQARWREANREYDIERKREYRRRLREGRATAEQDVHHG